MRIVYGSHELCNCVYILDRFDFQFNPKFYSTDCGLTIKSYVFQQPDAVFKSSTDHLNKNYRIHLIHPIFHLG